MIDYVPLLLANMVGGLLVLATFLIWGLESQGQRSWAPAFGIAGLVATVGGMAMSLTKPIPEPFHTAYGHMSVLLGVLFLGAAWALAAGHDLQPLGVYALFPGLVASLIGVRFIQLSLTPAPVVVGIAFMLTGLGGLGAWVTLRARRILLLRLLGAAAILGATAIWAVMAVMAYWIHMAPPPSTP